MYVLLPLFFQNVFRPYKNAKLALYNSSGLKIVFKNHFFQCKISSWISVDGSPNQRDLTVRFQIFPTGPEKRHNKDSNR